MTNLAREGLLVRERSEQISSDKGSGSVVVDGARTYQTTLCRISDVLPGRAGSEPAETTPKPMARDKRPLGERVHSNFLGQLGLTSQDFSHERVARVMAALNAVRAPLSPMVGEVLWLSPPTAFTLPGRYVYITRRFIERCRSDDPVAFALAHEIAHHDLGHLSRAERWVDSALAFIPAALAVLTLERVARWLHSRDNELAADAYALGLCRKAGFDPKRCLQCFDILGWYMLDLHDLDGVYGTDEELELDPDRASNLIGRISTGWRRWRAQHRRSHPSLHKRRQILLSQIADTASSGSNRLRPRRNSPGLPSTRCLHVNCPSARRAKEASVVPISS
jgi:Zn-dependent protease with chaperone function